MEKLNLILTKIQEEIDKLERQVEQFNTGIVNNATNWYYGDGGQSLYTAMEATDERKKCQNRLGELYALQKEVEDYITGYKDLLARVADDGVLDLKKNDQNINIDISDTHVGDKNIIVR